jgi:NADPH2:quinone reductase
MKAMLVSRHGPPDALTLTDLPIPQPGPGEVLVRNRVIGVNFVDTQHRAGLYWPVQLPLVPGVEAAGTVAAVGQDVTDFRVGDRVACAGYMGGIYAEYSLIPQGRLISVPEALPLEQVAACLMQGTTSHVLTHQVHPVKAGDTVLVYAAAGGVGMLLVQMAKRLGATVIGTTSSEEKAAAARSAGADHVVLYAEAGLEDAIVRLTGGQRVHVIYDGVGGTLVERSLPLLRARGHLVEYGQSGGRPMPLDISRLSGITGSNNRGSLSLTWASASDYLTTTQELRSVAQAVFDAVLAGDLRIHIAQTYPLEDAAQAHAALESRAVSGKLLLVVDS